MHRYFPFDQVTINNKDIVSYEIVAGTMRFISGGQDTAVTMGGGWIRFFRQTIRQEAQFEVFGDRSDLTGLKPVPVVFQYRDSDFISFAQALIRADYHEERHSTRIRIHEVLFP